MSDSAEPYLLFEVLMALLCVFSTSPTSVIMSRYKRCGATTKDAWGDSKNAWTTPARLQRCADASSSLKTLSPPENSHAH